MSVVSVPFESVGEGSIPGGYGLAGTARWSEGSEDLRGGQQVSEHKEVLSEYLF